MAPGEDMLAEGRHFGQGFCLYDLEAGMMP